MAVRRHRRLTTVLVWASNAGAFATAACFATAARRARRERPPGTPDA